MASACGAPYAPQDVQEVQTLVSNLEGSTQSQDRSGQKRFSCKKSAFHVIGSPKKIVVYSWRIQDWAYKRSDLPTYARGLFTTKNDNGQHEIAMRGYNKFFNTEEVGATRWRNIEENTKGPYELSLKENGCIIFISGLWDGTLLVCSKHSTGPRADGVSHAVAGEQRLDRQLAAIGKTRNELARELNRRNATAVAELCDDSFEEHILAYTGESAGLYLHGININIPGFLTYPGHQVHAFAQQWGFLKTDFLVLNDIIKTKKFLEDVAETGSYNGRDVEGFVIRCKIYEKASSSYTDWFFKYKFEEPYLMYRQWRECTKSLISGKTPRFKKHVAITQEYLLFARKQLTDNPQLGQAYSNNHGIIKLRNDFLKEKNLKSSDIMRLEYSTIGGAQEDVTKNVILVPIATIGCGKTTLAVALGHLFGWEHVQNDNIIGKGRPPRFTKEVLAKLEDKPVVFADRNNASKHERRQIIDDVHLTHPHVRLVALNFVHDIRFINRLREITRERVFSRGDNHQTIQAATDQKKVVGIMENFINRFEPLDPEKSPDDGFDAVIDLDPVLDSRENLETVVGQLHNYFPKLVTDTLSGEDLDEAINFALNEYKPNIRHEIPDRGGPRSRSQNQQAGQADPQKSKRPKPLEYIAVMLPRTQILEIIERAFASVYPNKSDFWRQLNESHRVQSEFHVTLIHRASAKMKPQIWQRYCDLQAEASANAQQTENAQPSANAQKSGHKIGHCKILLERIVWDTRIMAIVVRLVDGGWECVNQVAHITVWTRADDVKPKESNEMLMKWNEVGCDKSGIREVYIKGHQTVEGTVMGVLSR